MLSVLFWNLDGKPHRNAVRRAENLVESIARLAATKQIDVLVFAECAIPDARLVERLNEMGAGLYYRSPIKSEKLRVYTRLERSAVVEVFSDGVQDRISIVQIERAVPPGILLAAAHFQDRMSVPSSEGRTLAAVRLARSIESAEDEAGHERTVLVGDLNMNPFEGGLVGAEALHAVMTRRLAATVQDLAPRKSRRCFYNPMWGHFGDLNEGPSGTYYYQNAGDLANPFWNIYDQVLVRPALVEELVHVEIVDRDGQQHLTTKGGRPRSRTFSDHLPIFVQLDV